MSKPLLIAVSVALALSVTACKRDESRAERENMAPGANIATTPPPSSPVDTGGAHSSGATTGTGAGGMTSGPDQTGGPGTPYGTQSSIPPTGTPSAGAGSAAGSNAGADTTAR